MKTSNISLYSALVPNQKGVKSEIAAWTPPLVIKLVELCVGATSIPTVDAVAVPTELTLPLPSACNKPVAVITPW